MKRKKILGTISAIVLGAVTAAGCLSLTACGHSHTFKSEWEHSDTEHWHAASCEHTDEKSDVGAHVYDGDTDDSCNTCGYVRHDFDTTQWLIGFDGHYNPCKFDGCAEHGNTTEHNFDSNNLCSTCNGLKVEAEFLPSDLEATKYTEGYTNGFFSLLPGTTVRTRSRENYNVYDYNSGEGAVASNVVKSGFTASKSIKYDGSAAGFSVKAPAAGRITVYLDNGSSGKTNTDKQTVVLTRPDNTTEVISYFCGNMYAVTIDCATAGTYKITRGNTAGVGTTDVYYVKFETVVAETPVEKIEISNKGKVEYIKGEAFDSSKLQLETVHETTGVKLPLATSDPNVTIDSSAYNPDVAGTYKITVSYAVDGKTFKAEYDVVVRDVEALKLGFNKIVQGGNTTAGNGQYINKTVKQFYFSDEALSVDGLTVKTVMNEGKLETIVTDGYGVSGFTQGQAGKQTVRVAWNDNAAIYSEYDVYVANYTAASVTVTGNQITVNVNAAVEDSKVGVLESGAYQFKTIQQSLDFLNALNLDKNVKKVINLAEGTYKEKLEVNIPNLTIKGADNTHPEKTMIEWDSLVGLPDESGYIHVTDSTATLNVRDKAVGFVIEGVTVSNWYNSTAHFDEKLGANYAEHRALAMLVQADKVVIDNCRLLGYQDTIELFTGRQVVQNTYICGRTDFIFGTNNTTYFKNCTIESIVDGGYVTAFKGCNKGAGDYVQYGAIFDECDFIAPQAVIDKKDTSLGRTWGAYAAVAYVNCDFLGHISTKPYGDGKGTRYTAMSGSEPTTATVKFVEYNNTGAGAVTTQIAGMTLLTNQADGAKYSDLSVIFATTNGKVTYADTWDGSKGVKITTVDYRFGDFYNGEDAYTYHAIPASGEDILGGLATVTGTNWGHELNQNKDQAKFDKDCVIQLKTAGKVTVTTFGSGYGDPDNVKIVYINGVATIYIVATVEHPLNNGCYITLIQLNTEELPAHVHDYGEWTIATYPTASAEGLAEKTCNHCEEATAHKEQVTLPVLSTENYEISASTTAGKATYTYTTAGEETIVFEAEELAGNHQHSYGDWTTTATLEAAGTASKTCISTSCNNDEHKTVTVNVPALNSPEYTITNNTATLDAAGTGTYTITVGEETVTFTAATPIRERAEITTDKTFNFRSTQPYKEETKAGETHNYEELIIKGNTNGSFKSNNGDWYIIAGDATLELKIKSGTTVTVQIGYCQDCLTFSFDGSPVTEDGTKLTKSAYAGNLQTYTFVADADGILAIGRSSTASGTTYIGRIAVTVPTEPTT